MRVALVTLVIIVGGTISTSLSHYLRVSESTLNGTSKLLCVTGISIIVTDSLLLVSAHSIELVLGSGVLGSIVEGWVGVRDGARHARRNTRGWCGSRGRSVVCVRSLYPGGISGIGGALRTLVAIKSLLWEASLMTVLTVASDSGTVRLSGLLLRHASEDGLHAPNETTARGVVVVHARHQLLLMQLLLVVILLRKSSGKTVLSHGRHRWRNMGSRSRSCLRGCGLLGI